jgi:predicted ArsR family transcriptional regulator
VTDLQHDVLASRARRAIHDHLLEHPEGASAIELAELLGSHVTTTRFHLDHLIQAGLVASFNERDGAAGRPTKRYVAVTPGTGATPFQLLAEVLTTAVASDASPEEAGYRWSLDTMSRPTPPAPATTVGAWMGKVGSVVDLLDDWGYDADVGISPGGQDVEIGLNECPFRELAEANPEVVCAVHRGLIRGALAAAGEPSVRVDLSVFETPDRCLARLNHSKTFRRDKHKEQT